MSGTEISEEELERAFHQYMKFLDLVIYGAYYEDEAGNRIDPTTVIKVPSERA